VRRAARNLVDAGLEPVVVVISDDGRFADALAGLRLLVVNNPAPELGISRSIAIGLGLLPETTEAALIAVGDQPHLTADAIVQLVRAFSAGRIVVPRYGDHRGNPPVFDRRFFPELLRLKGDRGGQAVVAAHPEAVVEVSLLAAMGDDVDRPEEWPA
jgi:molybdenum cofactor cytidylyltransferase